jgi:hypothetical protein
MDIQKIRRNMHTINLKNTVKSKNHVIDIMLQKLGMSCQTTIGKKHFPINLRV